MADRITVTLGGTSYEVPKMNVGQLKRVRALFSGATENFDFDLLAIALERAEPKVENIDDLVLDFDEASGVAGNILEMSGLKRNEAKPGDAVPGELKPVAG